MSHTNTSSAIRYRLSVAAAVLFILVLSGCTGGAGASKFDGKNAYALLKRQCDLGPRPLGTPAHEATAGFLTAHMKEYADRQFEQKFTHESPSRKRVYTGRNIFGVFGKNPKRWVLLLAHYDTRPTADEEVDPAKAKKPIPGANDGASGCAALLELARVFHEKPAEVGVVMMFVDGEDFGPSIDEMFLGSKAFAEKWREVMKPVPGFREFEYGILLDMVGDRDLLFRKESYSMQRAPEIVNKIWTAADELGYGKYFSDAKPGLGQMIQDDHLPLLTAGIKCVDVIDFDYPYWHTLEDTPDKCSAASLQVIGDVIRRVVYSEGL